MPQGFKTAQGSLYRLTAQGQTIRTKHSAGPTRGTTFAEHNCLYIEKKAWDFMLSAKNQDNDFVLGYANVDGTGFTYFKTDVLAIPQGMIPAVHVYDPEAEKSVALIPAKAEAAIGLYPVENRFEADPSLPFNSHIGNAIVEIYE